MFCVVVNFYTLICEDVDVYKSFFVVNSIISCSVQLQGLQLFYGQGRTDSCEIFMCVSISGLN